MNRRGVLMLLGGLRDATLLGITTLQIVSAPANRQRLISMA